MLEQENSKNGKYEQSIVNGEVLFHRDVIFSNTQINFSFKDRIKILLGMTVHVDTKIYTMNHKIDVLKTVDKIWFNDFVEKKRERGLTILNAKDFPCLMLLSFVTLFLSGCSLGEDTINIGLAFVICLTMFIFILSLRIVLDVIFGTNPINKKKTNASIYKSNPKNIKSSKN